MSHGSVSMGCMSALIRSWDHNNNFTCSHHYFKSAGARHWHLRQCLCEHAVSVADICTLSDLKSRNTTLGIGLHLQGQAVVSRSLVFAAVVLAIIHVDMVQLQEAHQISGCLQRGRQRRMHDFRITWGIETSLQAHLTSLDWLVVKKHAGLKSKLHINGLKVLFGAHAVFVLEWSCS